MAVVNCRYFHLDIWDTLRIYVYEYIVIVTLYQRLFDAGLFTHMYWYVENNQPNVYDIYKRK